MFRAYLSPSSGGTTVCVQQLILSLLFSIDDCLLSWLDSNTRLYRDARSTEHKIYHQQNAHTTYEIAVYM
jgi:hypothetical protein